MNKLLLFFALIAFLAACAQESQQSQGLQTQLIGEKITASYKIGDKIFYLPEGEWIIVGSGNYETHLLTSFKSCSVFNWVYLADIRENTLYRAVYANANIKSCGARDWADEPCKRTNYYYKNDMKRGTKDQFCLSISHNFPYLVRATGSYVEIYRWFNNHNISIPNTAMSVAFTRYYPHEYMSVVYFFNPEVIGISPSKGNTWETNDWNNNNISQYPQKEQFAEKLVEWGNQMPPLILYGFNREGTEPQSIPKPPF